MEFTQAQQIAALTERLGRLLGRDAHNQGLLPVHWEVLRYLQRANRFSRNSAALTAFLGLTKGTVSQTIKTLEANGLVRKQVDAGDRRRIRLALSAKGVKFLRKDPLLEMVGAIEQLPTVARGNLAEALELLLRNRLEAQRRQPFGQCLDCCYFASEHPEGGPHYCDLLKEKLNNVDARAICVEQMPGR
jgi:DNA-binding MarR family transcriptional regulator